MNESNSAKQKWPSVVASLSVLYAVLFCIMYLRLMGIANKFVYLLWNMAIVASMLLGAVGLFIRKSWATRTLQVASWLAIIQCLYSLFRIFGYMGGLPPSFVMLGILTMMAPTIAWPVFLVIWLSKHKLSNPKKELEI
jgi:hypothetical protein